MRLLIVKGSSFYSFFFGRSDRFLRNTEAQALFGSHLDKDKVIFVPGYNINLALRTTVVGFQDTRLRE